MIEEALTSFTVRDAHRYFESQAVIVTKYVTH